MIPPTPRANQALDAIRRLTVEGVAPTYVQIRDAVGLKSISGVHRLLGVLRDRGLIEWQPGIARSVRVVGDDWSTLDMMSTTALRVLKVRLDVVLAEREGAQ